MQEYIGILEEINKTKDYQKYILIQKLIDSGYCKKSVEILQTIDNTDYRNIIIKLLIEFSNNDHGRKELIKTNLSLFICTFLKNEQNEIYILDLVILVGNLGICDTTRPILFNNNVATILMDLLDRLSNIESKLKIINSISMLTQTKLESQEFYKLGVIRHIIQLLSIVETDEIKYSLSRQIYWISYLCNNKDIINDTDCINIMYKAVEKFTNKSLQSQIFWYIYYFIDGKKIINNMPIYSLWKDNFAQYNNDI
jgi:hypothetical protein